MDPDTPVYLDYNATTPVDPRVLRAMEPFFTQCFGNPASRSHSYGRRAAAAVEEAREAVARLIGASSPAIVFTSGATESNNLALKGVAGLPRGGGAGGHIVTCATEHRSVLDTCAHLERCGVEVTRLGVDRQGLLPPGQVGEAITDHTVLVSVMLANNEIGTVQPVAAIAAAARSRGVLLHCDATQAVGRIPVDVETLGVDLLSLSAHKFYGPKGVGALYVRAGEPRVRLAVQMHGGGQERGRRGGTLNVPGIVGLGAAARLCAAEMPAEALRLAGLRDRLHRGILARIDGVTLHGHPVERLPNTLNLGFTGIVSEGVMNRIRDVAVSGGAACASGAGGPSHVLTAIGLDRQAAQGALRFSLGRFTTAGEIDFVVAAVAAAVQAERAG